jgi:hypothetical protein
MVVDLSAAWLGVAIAFEACGGDTTRDGGVPAAAGPDRGDSSGGPGTASTAGADSGGNTGGPGTASAAGAASGRSSGDPGTAGTAGSYSVPGASRVDELFGIWETAGAQGDCTNERIFLTFEPPDRITFGMMDDNLCYGPGTLQEVPGRFVVTGERTLQIAWEGFLQWMDWKADLDAPIARYVEEYAFATVEISDTSYKLVTGVYIPVDNRTWRRRTVQRFLGEDSALLQATVIDVQVRFDAPVPLVGNSECRMTVDAEVVRESETTGENDSYAAELYVVPCVVEPQESMQRIWFDRFGPGDALDRYQAWQAFLEEQGYEQAHPQWVRDLLQGGFYPSLWLDPTDPTYLCLNGRTSGWSLADGPPSG